MTTIAAAGRRILPRGWADLARQLAIWFGFLLVYQAARGIADRNPPKAFDNGLHVIGIERHAHALFELTLQRIVDGSQLLATLVSWTYWNSEFTVVGLALMFVYLRRNDAFVRFRNAILLANVIGLVGYVALPTAPERSRNADTHYDYRWDSGFYYLTGFREPEAVVRFVMHRRGLGPLTFRAD